MRDLFPVSTDFFYPENTFDDFFKGLVQPSPVTQIKLPRVDIEETSQAYVVSADLPGLTKDKIIISYDNDILTMASQQQDNEQDTPADKRYLRQERFTGPFKRQFIIRNIQKDQISATYENGVLTITLPKADPNAVAASNRIDIK